MQQRRHKERSRYRGVVIYGRASEEEQAHAARELASFWRYAAALVEARTKSPGDDFVSALVKARDVDGDNTSVKKLEADIRTFIHRHNQNPRPLKWTRSADKILASVKRFCHKAQWC